MPFVIHVLKGFVIGAANVIPGVSGGTMALLMGVYRRIVTALSRIDLQSLRDLQRALRSAEARRDFVVKYDLAFLAALFGGAVLAVVTLARVLRWAIAEAHDPTYGFFFGLVALSVWAPLRECKRVNAAGLAALVCGAAAVVGLATVQSPSAKLQNAYDRQVIKMQSKSDIVVPPAITYRDQEGEVKPASRGIPFLTEHLTEELSYEGFEGGERPAFVADTATLFLSGGAAVSAMILPGVSGAFLLLLFGVYFRLLDAIASFEMLSLAAFAAGCGLGLLLFSKVLRFLMEHAHDVTMLFLTGLVAGSLYAIWPFQAHVMVNARRVDLAAYMPQTLGESEILTGVFALVGAVLVLAFYWLDRRVKQAD